MKNKVKLGLLSGVAVLTTVAACQTIDSGIYNGFPITVENYSGAQTNSVSYTGQVARHALHESKLPILRLSLPTLWRRYPH